MKIFFVLFIIALMMPSALFAQQKDEPRSIENKTLKLIRELERKLREATLINDAETSGDLKADDWVNINFNGTISSKTQTLDLMRKKSFTFLSIEDKNVTIHLYDGAAIVSGESLRKFSGPNNSELTRHLLFTRVWAKRGKHWLLVASTATPVIPPRQLPLTPR